MASKKKEELLQPEVQTQAQPAAQSTYSAEGLNSRADVEKAMANTSYRPSQQVTDAADALKQWQQNRPADYQSSYQDRINELLGQLLERENFQYSYTRDPLYRQYEQLYTQNAHNASADAAAQAAALTGGYGSSYATSAAQQAYQQQIGGLASAIPTLYNLALDTYQSGGEELVNRLDQLNGQEQNAQTLYDRQLQDYYTQLQQKGEAYNDAYAKDYGQYQEHLNRLDTLHGYYTAQEQAEISQRQQAFNNIMTVLGIIGDVVQLAISGIPALPVEAVTLQSPIPCPAQDVVCLGINYMAHSDEAEKYSADAFATQHQDAIYFSKRVSHAVPDGGFIEAHTDLVQKLDYECELAVVLGKDAKDVPAGQTKDYVFGYTILNDVSARDVQTAHKQWYFGKSLDGFTPIGPCIVTADAFADYPPRLGIRSFVNGEKRQDSNTALQIFDIDHVIAELSQGMTLKAGTIIATGTPAGVGMGMDPPQFLHPGDTVQCEIEGIGTLTNTVR